MEFLYLICLSVSLFGLHTLDKKYQLAFYDDARRATKAIGLSLLFFIAWDGIGIAMGIFFHGESIYSLPLRLAPEFPLEELLFLTLLCYTALLLYIAWGRRCLHT